MALMKTAASTPSGDSHTSSPELSPDMDPSVSTSATSPLSLPASLTTTTTTTQDEPERGNESGRSTPARSPQDLTRSRPPTRGGCWTCRIRRKKCDEERVDGDSCKTCKRLGINCLGWGSRRPEWMRDKEKVAQYKADIKAQLTRAGLIRGQPRAMYAQLTGPSTPSSSTATPSSRAGIRGTGGMPSVAPPHDRYAHSAIAGPGPSTTTTLRSRRIDPYSPYGIDHSTPFPSRPPSSMMSALPGLDNLGTSDMSLPPFVMPHHHHQQPTYTSHGNPPGMYTPLPHPSSTPNSDMFASSTTTTPYPSPHALFDVSPLSHPHPHPPPPSVSPVNHTSNIHIPTNINIPSNVNMPMNTMNNANMNMNMNMGTPRILSPTIEPTDQLVAYYFEHVRKLQFAFAGPELTQVLYLILQRDPHGPLKHALCALASLHSTKLQMHGFDEDSLGPRPMHKRYFDQGHRILLQRRSPPHPHPNPNPSSSTPAGCAPTPTPTPSSPGAPPPIPPLSEDDAIAAVFLIAYYMMVGGGHNWLKLLDIAHDWFAQSGLVEEQNPRLKLWNMPDAQRLAVKTVMWIDIQSSIIFTTTPRFLAVYRRLLGSGGGGFWGTSPSLTGSTRGDLLRMDKLTGCPDEAVLALAETAHLASWKAHQQQTGCLSVRELVGRADQIEQTLRQTSSGALGFRSVSSSPVSMGEGAPSGMVVPSGLPAPVSDMFGGAGGTPGFEMDEAARRAIPQVWRETAVLYLHTVVSDALPGVREIQKSVSTLGDWFNGFNASDLDRAILLPLIFTATLTDNAIVHDIVKGRITLHGSDMMFNGAMAQAANFVDYVWQRRRSRPSGVPVDWRECMRERWSSLVMV